MKNITSAPIQASIFFLFIFILFSCSKDSDLVAKDSDMVSDPLFNEAIFPNGSSIPDSLLESSYSILQSLPLNYDTTGIIDYTDIIQNVLDNYAEVTFPDFPLLINQNGLTLRSNSKIFFKKGSKLVLQSNSKERYEVLRLHEVHNVELYSPHILGDRETHLGNTGEWGFGISVQGSQKINIYKAEVKNCWGDGIYLGSRGSLVNKDIVISDCFIDNSRRNGISITSGINIDVVNTVISNTNGVTPMAAIDIEPNTNLEVLNNINLTNVTTVNSEWTGISIYLLTLAGAVSKDISITIENHLDEGSGRAMGFALGLTDSGFAPITGSIDVNNSVWKDNVTNLVIWNNSPDDSVHITFDKPSIIHKDDLFSQNKVDILNNFCSQSEYFSFIE